MSIGLRINRLKTDKNSTLQSLHDMGATSHPVDIYEDALIVEGVSTTDIMDHESYKNGEWYIQSIPSMIPALVLNPQHEEVILDVCAAPGSKTIQMAELMNNTGTIIANDISRDRLYKIKRSALRHNITSIHFYNRSGEAFGRTHPNFFDAILVDVPCSMGQDYAQKNLKRLVQRQRKLLTSAYFALKPGGRLVYSTCSPRSEENEDVIRWFLKKNPHAYNTDISQQNLNIPHSWISDTFVTIQKTDSMPDFFIAHITKPHIDISEEI